MMSTTPWGHPVHSAYMVRQVYQISFRNQRQSIDVNTKQFGAAFRVEVLKLGFLEVPFPAWAISPQITFTDCMNSPHKVGLQVACDIRDRHLGQRGLPPAPVPASNADAVKDLEAHVVLPPSCWHCEKSALHWTWTSHSLHACTLQD